jgi:hypothetical protein
MITSRAIGLVGHVEHLGEKSNAYVILVGKLEGGCDGQSM